MSNLRRCYVPRGFYFFTVVTERRAPILGNAYHRWLSIDFLDIIIASILQFLIGELTQL